MKYLNQIYANRKPPKYALGGFPVVGSINPETGQPYTIEEINSYTNTLNPFPNNKYGITAPIITDSSTVNSLDGLTGLSDKPLGKVRPNYFNRMSDAQVKGINAGISAGANLVTPLIDEASKSSVVDDLGVTHTKESVAGGAASGAAKGLAISASLGFADFGASAVIGGLVGGLQSKLGNDKVDSQMRDATNSVYNKKVDFAKTRYKTLKSQGFNEAGKQTTMFAEGGPIEGMTGMMKSKIALEAEFGNPAAKRMVSANPKRGKTPEGEGTHYMATFGEYAVPLLQDKGGESLVLVDGLKPSKEDFKFRNAEEANYFAEHYKEIAPMMRSYAKGGNLVPQYEVEGNEVIQGTDTQLEGQENLASDMTKAVGPSHANGGVKGNGGERVFSDRLYASPMLTSTLKALKIKLSNNPTYAEAAEAIAKKKGKFEKNIKSPDPISNKTANTMVERMDSLIEGVFQEQEILKQVENNNTVMAFGGKIPKYFKGADLVEQFTPEQAANTAAYLSNLKSANKQKTGFKRNVGEPVLLEKMDYLPIAKNSIYGAARTGYLSNKRSSGNVQDRFSRDAAITTSTMEALNQAIQSQSERDLNINNANAQILGNYNARKAEAENADMIDKIQGENDILVNKRAATNAWLQGIMGNVASKRAYDVEKAKIAIARMDGGRGTAGRSDEDLALMVQSKTIAPNIYKMLTGKDYVEPKHSKGGYIKKSKKYC